jgi:hypothetical protein
MHSVVQNTRMQKDCNITSASLNVKFRELNCRTWFDSGYQILSSKSNNIKSSSLWHCAVLLVEIKFPYERVASVSVMKFPM